MAKTTGEILVDVQFDCICLYDGSIYRKIISVPSEDLSKPDVITYLRELIEVKLSIPIVCQVNLSLGGICLDPIAEEYSELPKRLWRNGERVPIYLEYYSKITSLQEIKQVITKFPNIVEDRNYRSLFSLLSHLNHDLINIGQGGWASESALGARIYLKHCGFLSDLKILFANILKEISEKFSKLRTIQAFDSVKNFDPKLNFFKNLSNINQKERELIVQLDYCKLGLTGILSFIWNFGARWEDRIYLRESGFFDQTIQTLLLTDELKNCHNIEIKSIGKSIYDKAIGVLGGLVELKELGITIGTNTQLINILKDGLYNCQQMQNDYIMEELLLTLIFFSASAHNEVTRTIHHYNLYNQIFQRYSTKGTVFPINVAAEYNIGMFCMHMLKTPYLQYDESVLNQMLCILKQIISKADVVSAAEFERSKCYIWGTLEPSLSIFVKPWHCLIVGHAGFIDSSDRLYTLVVELIECYDKVALYMFDVTLESERNRQQFIDEGLLPYFVIVSWRVAGITKRLRKFYPECLRQVPNLKQIATISVGFQKEGYFYARSLDI